MVAIIDLTGAGRGMHADRVPARERLKGARGTDWRLRAGLLGLTAVGLLVATQHMRLAVAERSAETAGGWQLARETLPAWWSASAGNAFDAMAALPDEIPLATAFWRERLESALGAMPWIDRVDSVERGDGAIHFRATVLRPVAVVRAGDGFVFLSSTGSVIDVARGASYRPQWAVPEWAPQEGPLDACEVGAPIGGDEVAQAVSILAAVVRHHVLERWPGAIREIHAQPLAGGDNAWRLVLANGTQLAWGRAPASRLPQPLSTARKVENLLSVMRDWERLDGAGVIEIGMAAQPLVIVE